MTEATYREAYGYDPETHERLPIKRNLLRELKAAIGEEIGKGNGFHDRTDRYFDAMEAIRNV